MSDGSNQETNERNEINEQSSNETRELDRTTQQPETKVEADHHFVESEAIEKVVKELVNEEPEHGPNPVTQTARKPETSGSEGVSATPINLPNPRDQEASTAPATSGGSEGVSVTPINLPNPRDQEASTAPTAPSGGEGVSATPINLPNPRDLEAGEMVTRANNLVSEEPTHGPNPFDNKFENVSIIEKTLGGNSPAETSKNIPNETAEMDTGEMDDTGLLQPEDVVDGGENVEKALYLYEDKDGNMIVVDADGNPVESPPGLVYNEKTGKYYASYNQDPTKGDTTGKDVSSLGKELPEYKKAVEEMYLYETEDGKQIVVDADGNPIKSPPGLTYDETTGKYYASYGGLDPAKMDPTGIDKSQLGLELPQYKKPLDGLSLYEDQDGNIVVVDVDGNPIKSPPGLTYDETTGKYYASYGGGDPAKLDPTGKDKSQLGLELPKFKKSLDGLSLYEDQDGNMVVVGANGSPVASPPGLVYDEATGKYYASYGGEDPAKMDQSGKDKTKLGLELPKYKKPLDGLKLYTDSEGNPVVVDADGNPVSSPPGLTYDEVTGKYFASYGGDDPAKLDKAGNEKSNFGVELSDYEKPINDMYIFEDDNGKMIVVDENGIPVQSPPGLAYNEQSGKYYASYSTDPIKADGAGKMTSKSIVEMKHYKPKWWKE